jgi:hypothetical protein
MRLVFFLGCAFTAIAISPVFAQNGAADHAFPRPLRTPAIINSESIRVSPEKIDDTLKTASQAALSATDAAGLDSPLAIIEDLRDRLAENDPRQSSRDSAVVRLQSALDELKGWQDYLVATQSGYWDAAHQSLQKLANADPAVFLIPRSKILDHLHDPKPPAAQSGETATIEKILSELKSPKDLTGVIDSLTQLDDPNQYVLQPTPFRQTIQHLSQLLQASNDANAGRSVDLPGLISHLSGLPFEKFFAPVRDQIVTLALPAYIGLAADVKPHPGEMPHPFLQRIAADAAARGDYTIAARAVATSQWLSDATSFVYQGLEITQGTYFVNAESQEAVRGFAEAVKDYEFALACPVTIVPPTLIGQRLASIKATHSQDYQFGLDSYLATPRGSSRIFPPPIRQAFTPGDSAVGLQTSPQSVSKEPSKP